MTPVRCGPAVTLQSSDRQKFLRYDTIEEFNVDSKAEYTA